MTNLLAPGSANAFAALPLDDVHRLLREVRELEALARATLQNVPERSSIPTHEARARSCKQFSICVVGDDENIEADVLLTHDAELGWRAAVVAEWNAELLTHQTRWVAGEGEALADAVTWLHARLLAPRPGAATIVELLDYRAA